jgi:hypothetical protein
MFKVEREMDNDFSRWMEYAEWRGQTVQALKDITCELKEMKVEIKSTKETLQKEISQIRSDNRKRDIKTAEIAGGTSMLIVVIGWITASIL